MNIVIQPFHVFLILNMLYFVFSLEKDTCPLVPSVKVFRVCSTQLLHKLTNTSWGDLSQKEVIVIWHQAIEANTHYLFPSIIIKSK
ncbi:MAG: hypothetical protein ACI83D_000610 [Planctomycetota bacterium]|jgi:hypothetical protein